MAPKPEPAPQPRTLAYLIELLALQAAEIAALKAWQAQVEAVWPQIIEEVTNGAD